MSLSITAGMLAVLTIGASPASAASFTDPNLLSNGSFEGAGSSPGPVVGWTNDGGTSAAYVGASPNGSYLADFVPNKAGGSILQDVGVSAGAGQRFQASLWLRAGKGSVVATVALFGNLRGSGAATRALVLGPAWQKVSLTMPLSATTTAVRLQIFGNTGTHINIADAALTYQLLADNSFEATVSPAPMTGWRLTGGNGSSVASRAAEDGNYFADFVPHVAGANVAQDVPVVAGVGQIYQASVWVRTTSPDSVLAIWGNVNATGSGSTRIPASSEWQQVTVSMALRARTTTIRVQIYAALGAHLNLDNALLTPTGPGIETSAPPVSTSRYPRDLTGAATDVTLMRNRGMVDATNNPSNHAYLQLIDIGGQNQAAGGVVLSATSRFITYAQLVNAMKGYIAGYASRQYPGAPAVIAIGTNNDMDVSALTGRLWAIQVINPLVTFAASYPGLTIAGADDIEPGFSATVASSRAWLSGYLAATGARFVFNGSADGCSPSAINSRCNNRWLASDLYWLGGGAASTRIIALPQIYNPTMAEQWGYISLTGVAAGQARVNFGGTLTEVTACAQSGSCYSMGAHPSWLALRSAINSNVQTAQANLPSSTDLRIN